jgi:N-acyl-D-amino-acid deacylase
MHLVMRPIALGVMLTIVGACGGSRAPDPAGPATVLVDARIVDGSGAPARSGAVRIVGDRIDAVGDVRPRAGDRVVDAHGLVLAPGFIDTHSHADRELDGHPDALAAVSQGITTVVGGQDGDSPYPLADYFTARERSPAAVNVASYVGHGTVRERVMGRDFRRVATAGEVARMDSIVRREMAAGALGLSSGLEYDPGIYSSTDELLALARTTGALGGRYISHIRSEDRGFWRAIDEILRIGREARLPVQVSHVKLAMRGIWGEADSLVRVLDRARASGVDVTADVYPYLYWQSTLTVLFPERNFEDRKAAEFALTQTSTPGGLLLGRFDPDPSYVGKTVAEISALRGTDSVTTLIALIREAEAMAARVGHGVESVIGTSMTEAAVARLIAWPYANVCTDGELDGRHPRGYGTFARVLGEYVRARRVIPLEEAVRKMTSLAAHNVGLHDRGTIVPGGFADLVLFDPATVADRATPTDPHALSTGIARVWVNGTEVFNGAAATTARPGRVLRRR